MDAVTAQNETLELAVEDFYGLWEIIWRFRALSPHSTDPELRTHAENAVRTLLAGGLVALFRRSKVGGEESPVDQNEIEAALSDQSNWDEPKPDSVQMLVGATSLGERVYYRET